MTVINIITSNTTGLANGDSVSIVGKNGFRTHTGSIPLLVVTEPSKVDVAGDSSNIQFVVNSIEKVWDRNFLKHTLNVIDGSFQNLKGVNRVSIPIVEKNGTGATEGFVGYNTDLTRYSAEILEYDNGNGIIKIDNAVSSGTELIDVLPPIPFYIKIGQVLDTRFFNNNWVYVEGYTKNFEKIYNVVGQTGSNTFSLGITPHHKNFISIYKDEELLTSSDFMFNEGNSFITYSVLSGTSRIRTVVSHYTVPLIEEGDNLSIAIGSDSNYPISNVTYDPFSDTYNAYLTANSIYMIKFSTDLRSNSLSGAPARNISDDLFEGTLNNLDSVNNSFTVDYVNTSFVGNFHLANNKVYKLSTFTNFTPVSFGEQKIISNLPTGTTYVRARSVNPIGRRSPWVTENITFKDYLIGKISDLNISEQLYKDTSLGIVVNVEISFTRISGQDISHYELAYKLTSESETSTSGSFNTVEIPSSSLDADNKIRYTIFNIERGRATGVNSITVEVTPVSSTNIRGITESKSQTIVGKTAAPANIENVSGGQSGSNLLFTWDIPTNSDGSFVDIDLFEIETRRAAGIIDSANLDSYWIQGRAITKVAAPASSVVVPIRNYGTYTYMFRAKDTSGNYSDSIAGFTITTARPVTDYVYKKYSESNALSNVVFGLPNDNADEYYFPSLANSNNGGISETFTSSVDNANGTASGFITVTNPTDLFAAANAVYQTQVRDVGDIVTGTILSSVEGVQFSRTTFNDFRSNLIASTAETGTTSSVVFDTNNSGIGAYLASATYNVMLNTLTSGGPTGNVFAIWNSGQFANDSVNANGFAFIAGVANDNAIVLGETFYSNGEPTLSNVFANMDAGTNYELVDLVQFDDNDSKTFFQGKDLLTTVTEEYRTTSSNPFFANGNVDSSVFITSDSDSDGWRSYSPTSQIFRYFQLRYSIVNDNPQLADYTLDEISYSVELGKKTYSSEVTVISNPLIVDYTPTNFLRTPAITLTANSAIGIISTYANANTTAAEVRNFYLANGNPANNIVISFKAEGI